MTDGGPLMRRLWRGVFKWCRPWRQPDPQRHVPLFGTLVKFERRED